MVANLTGLVGDLAVVSRCAGSFLARLVHLLVVMARLLRPVPVPDGMSVPHIHPAHTGPVVGVRARVAALDSAEGVSFVHLYSGTRPAVVPEPPHCPIRLLVAVVAGHSSHCPIAHIAPGHSRTGRCTGRDTGRCTGHCSPQVGGQAAGLGCSIAAVPLAWSRCTVGMPWRLSGAKDLGSSTHRPLRYRRYQEAQNGPGAINGRLAERK